MTPDTGISLAEIADTAAELAELQRSALAIVDRAWSVDRSRALLDGPAPAFDAALWATFSDLGWPSVLVPEREGGGDGTLRELAVLTEAAGTVAAPVPLAAAAAASWCENRCTDDVTLLVSEPATRSGDTVTHTFGYLPYGTVASRLVVLTAGSDPVLGAVDLTGPGVTRTLLTPLDRNPAALVTLERAPLEPITGGTEATRRHREAVMRMRVATVAEIVGVASAANDAATEYAKVRVAFDRPIGSFQAIKHRLVDQRAAIEVGRALVNRAADACDHHQVDAAALVSLAAYWSIDTLRTVPEGATQVFGGIAYTWEHDAHVYLRRTATLVATLGSRVDHRREVTGWLARRG